MPAEAAAEARQSERALAMPPPRPQERRLRVFSYDPLMATRLEELGTEQITLRLPWDFADGDRLGSARSRRNFRSSFENG